MAVPRTFSESMLNGVGNGEFTVTIANPLEFDFPFLPPKGTTLVGVEGPPPGTHVQPGPDNVMSIQTDGTVQVRSKGADGSFERGKKEDGWLCVRPKAGVVFRFPLAK